MHRYKFATSALLTACVAVLAVPAGAQDNAVIRGRVIFKGDVKKYKRQVIKTDKDPHCKKSKKKIGSEDVILNKKTDPITIRNVMVYVKEGLGQRKYDAPGEPIELDQFGCQYRPHVIAIMAGQPLRIKNGDPTNHNIHLLPKVNQELNFSQPRQGMEKDITLVKEDVFRVKCDVHPWMGCYVKVFDHPFHDVTGSDGSFSMSDLPPGKYVIEAWHEKFGTQTTTIEVASDQVKEVDFTFAPGT